MDVVVLLHELQGVNAVDVVLGVLVVVEFERNGRKSCTEIL